MRNTARGAGIVLGVAGLVGAGGYVLQSGGTSVDVGAVAQRQNRPSTPKPGAPGAGRSAVAALIRALGTARTAGAYVDRAGHTVVTVTGQSDAQRVLAADAVPKTVPYSGADLGGVTAMLRGASLGPGTGWGVNPQTDVVTVWADRTVTGARMHKLSALLKAAGPKARLLPLAGQLRTFAAAGGPVGGDAIFGGNVRCSLGFNAHNATQSFFVTAGHCGNAAAAWSADQAGTNPLGNTVKSVFPGHDFSLVSLAKAGNSSVDLFNGRTQQITAAADPLVGEKVSRTGSTTGLHTGTVQALNATVNFAEGTVTGMIQTTVCAEPGDSGGPLFAGTTALGLTSGGSGDCTAGGTTFFQPIVQALQTLGVQVGNAAQGGGVQGGGAPGGGAGQGGGKGRGPGRGGGAGQGIGAGQGSGAGLAR